MKKHLFNGRRMLGGLLCLFLATTISFAGVTNNSIPNSEEEMVANPEQSGKTITCIVSDADGPVVGANVSIKGTSLGNMTNGEGKAVINNVPANAVLVVSYIGYTTKEIPVGNKTTINVNLEEDTQALDEVVVTALGISRQEKSLGYSMTTLGGNDISKVNAANPITGMQGRVAGVQIDMGSSGTQSSQRIIIRGNTSLGSNNQPIFVVDGIIIDNEVTNTGSGQDFGNDLKNINTDDIASMSVLKGAAATALYGSRAANGVILVTTKKGQKGNGIGVSVSHTQQWEQIYDSFDVQDYAGSGSDPVWPLRDGVENRTGSVDISFGPAFDGKEATIDGIKMMWAAQKDSWRKLYQTGHYMNTNVAVQGGDEKGSFRFSYSNKSDDGITFFNTFDRNNFELNADRQISKRLKANAGFTFVQTKAQNPSYQNGKNNLYALMAVGGREYDVSYWLQHYKSENGDGYNGDDPYGNAATLYDYMENRYITSNTNFRARASLEFTLTDWLKFIAKGNINRLYGTYEGKVLSSGTSNYNGAGYTLNDNSKEQYQITGMLQASHAFKDFNIGGFVAAEQYDTRSGYHNTHSQGGLLVPGLFDMTNSVSDPITSVRYNTNRKRINSIYASANMSYKDVYFLDVTGRNDWSSALIYSDGHGHTSYFYPSVGASWLFVDGLRDNLPEWISFGKLRASYAVVGKDIDPYITTATGFYEYNNTFTSNLTGGSLPYYKFDSNYLQNLDLKPEKQHSIELGLNMRFLKHRLGFDFAYYKTNTKNQVLPLPISSGSGVSSRYINAGNIQNQGIELLIDGTVVQTKDFSWDLSANLTVNRNKIIELTEGVEKYQLQGGGIDCQAWATVGGAYGDIYTSYAFKRDANGNKLLDASGKYMRSGVSTKVGSIQPKFLWGATSTLKYKGLSLDFVVDARVGGDIASATQNYGTAYGLLKSTLNGRNQEWGGVARTLDDGRTVYDGIIPEGIFDAGTEIKGTDVSGWTYQQAVDKGLVQPVSASNYYYGIGSWSGGIRENSIMKCTWVALREISLNWNLPKKWINKAYLQDVSLSFVVRNVCYLYNSLPDNMHPESLFTTYSSEFYSSGGTPYTRNWGITVNVAF